MALTAYTGFPLLSAFDDDPFFSNVERAMDRAMGRMFGAPTLGFQPPRLSGAPGQQQQGAGGGMVPFGGVGSHPMDVVERPDAYEIHADAVSMGPDDIQVELNNRQLTIKGHKQEQKESKEGGTVLRRERVVRSFTRTFTLPENAREEGIAASLDKGVLKVIVPKMEQAPSQPQPKRITVQCTPSPQLEQGGDQAQAQAQVGGSQEMGGSQDAAAQ